jgi:hypothetical protein
MQYRVGFRTFAVDVLACAVFVTATTALAGCTQGVVDAGSDPSAEARASGKADSPPSGEEGNPSTPSAPEI